MVERVKSLLKLDSLRALQVFQLFRFASVMVISMILPRVLAGRELVGFYEKLMMIGGVATSFWVSGIINTLLPYYNGISVERQKKIMANALFLLSFLSVFVTLILFLLAKVLVSSHFDLFNLYLIYSLFSAPAFLTEYVLLLRKNSRGLFAYGIIFFLLQCMAVSIPVFFDSSLSLSIAILGATAALRYIFLVIYINKHYGLAMDMPEMGLFLKKISPYILSLIIGGSMAYIDSIFISHYYSNADFAIYRYGARELFFVTLMANAFSNAMSAELSTHHNNGNIAEGIASIKNRSTRLMHLLFPVTILLLLGSKYIFPLVFTAQFSASVPIFNIYLLLIISRLIFPQTVLLGIQKNKVLFRATAIEWVSNIILDAVFILFFMQFGHGMEGVAFATVLAYLLEKIILAWYCGKEGISFASYVPVKEWVLYSGITIGVYILASII